MFPSEMFVIRYKKDDYPYHQLVRANFRYYDSAMKKLNEMKSDPHIEEITLKKRKNCNSVASTIYSWKKGFETIYLGR